VGVRVGFLQHQIAPPISNQEKYLSCYRCLVPETGRKGTIPWERLFPRPNFIPKDVFAREIEHPLNVTIQCSHHSDARKHRWPVMFSNEKQSLHRCLPFLGIVFCLLVFAKVWRKAKGK